MATINQNSFAIYLGTDINLDDVSSPLTAANTERVFRIDGGNFKSWEPGQTAFNGFSILSNGMYQIVPKSGQTISLNNSFLTTSNIVMQNRTYYFSGFGDDANSGTLQEPFKTITKLNSLLATAKPGDRYLLRRGESFAGNISHSQMGSALLPIVIGAYGSDAKKPILITATGTGFDATNASHFVLEDIEIVGLGLSAATQNGINWYINDATKAGNAVFRNVTVTAFSGKGILIGSNGPALNGLIEKCLVHNLKNNGIETYNTSGTRTHVIRIEKTDVFNITGDSTVTNASTGSGIVLSNVQDSLIKLCHVHENGHLSSSTTTGPVGIRLRNAINTVVEMSESYRNYSGNTIDGGSFALEDDTENCVIQYCYAHEADGSGFKLSGANCKNHIVRYNVSERSGIKGSVAANTGIGTILLGSAGLTGTIAIYNNSLYIDANYRGLIFDSAIPTDTVVNFQNNTIFGESSTRFIQSDIAYTNANFTNNCYHTGGGYSFLWGTNTYTTYATWQSSATGRELNSMFANPNLTNVGNGRTIGNMELRHLFAAYRTQRTSTNVVDKGITIANNGGYDFAGHVVRSTDIPNIGAFNTRNT